MADNALYRDIYRSFQTDIAFGRRSLRAAAQEARTGGPRPGGLSAKQKAQLGRIARGSPQVMVKIISRAYNAASLKRTTDYIARDGDLELETRDGEIDAGDRESLEEIRGDWNRAYDRRDEDGRSAKVSLSIHMQLSMPAGTDRAAFKEATRAFVEQEIGPTNDYVMAFHDDTAHPHAHVVLQTRGDDGCRLRTDNEKLDQWRERFAELLRDRGIDADASPRHARGVDRRPLNRVDYYRMKQEKTSRNQSAHIELKRRELMREIAPRKQPWRAHMEARRALVKSSYQLAAEELSRSPERADRELAEAVSRFANGLQPIRTRDDIYERAVRAAHAKLKRDRETERSRQAPDRSASRGEKQEQMRSEQERRRTGADRGEDGQARGRDTDRMRELIDRLNKSADKDIER